MIYKYLYQSKKNENLEGEIKARNRAEVYDLLRKQGIRPYRVIGDDPWNWRPWAVAAGYTVMMVTIMVLAILLAAAKDELAGKKTAQATDMSDEDFRERAMQAVYQAPEAFRYNVWKGVNSRLEERGLEPLPRPEGMVEE